MSSYDIGSEAMTRNTNLSAIMDNIALIIRHPANRDRRALAVGKFVTWQLYKRIVGGHREIALPYSARFRCFPHSPQSSLMIYFNGLPDYDEMSFLRRYLRRGDNFIDVGANIGAYTILAMSSIGTEGAIVAYEPNARCVTRLKDNLALNNAKNVTIKPCGAGKVSAAVTLSTAQYDEIGHIVTDEGDCEHGKQEVVHICTLDETLPDLRYAAIKLDIEGYEGFALEGAIEHISAGNRPVWLFEVNGLCRKYGYTEEAICGTFKSFDYVVGTYSEAMNTFTVSDTPWTSNPNVFALQKSQLDMIMDRIEARLLYKRNSQECT